MRKINIDTDLRMAMTGAVRKHLAQNPSNFDPRKFLIEATKGAKLICKARYEQFGAAGNASKIKTIPMDTMAARYAKGELNPRVTGIDAGLRAAG